MNVTLQEKIKNLPEKPGVYIMKDIEGHIIYIGKAIVLKNRVRQYFQSLKNQLPKVQAMVAHIVDFEYIITNSEMEALVLECNLIKMHRPHYNILLKDDKHYPYIKITLEEEYPRIILTRQLLKDGGKYYGPYTDANSVRKTIDLISGLFSIRTCGRPLTHGKKVCRPCLNYQIDRCIAPCQGNISQETYMERIKEAEVFLSGKTDELIATLESRMERAAEALDFEYAAAVRDQIHAVRRISEKQKVLAPNGTDQDVVAFARHDADTCVQIFFIRGGKLIGREHFFLSGENLSAEGEESAELLTGFVKQYYTDCSDIPREIILQNEIEEMEILTDWLTEKRGHRVTLTIPQRGEKVRLVEMVQENAADALTLYLEKQKKDIDRTLGACAELRALIDGEGEIRRLEAFDISNIQGVDSVGSMIVFVGGKASPKEYRRFKIKTVEGANDYESMREIFRRRIAHGLREQREYAEQGKDIALSKFGRFPEVFMIDGGQGHVNAVLPILEEYGLKIPVCGMVKDDKHRTRGLIYQGKELPMAMNTNVFRMINAMQDEAHRFAISYHKSLRAKSAVQSLLDEIPGVGPARKKALLKYFGSVEKIKRAALEEIKKAPGLNEKVAQSIYDYFHK